METGALFYVLVCLLVRSTRSTSVVQFQQRRPTPTVGLPSKILTNINYAGLGYNALLGNPHDDLYDPGFQQAVIRLEYKTNSTTPDGKWTIPDHVQVLQTVSCSYSTDSVEVMGSTSYQRSLSEDASISFGLAGLVKFTASFSFSEIRQGTDEYRRSYVSSVARCAVYKVDVNHRYKPFTVTEDFATAVNSLPTVRDDKAYGGLIATYGTHFASTLYMGAKTVVRSEFEATNWTKLDEERFAVGAGADASFFVFAAGAKSATERQRRLAETFDKTRRSFRVSYVGSHPPPDGKWQSWATTTAETPYPIQYVLTPITELLNRRFFPNVDETTLTRKRDLLNASVDVYCNRLPGCGVPPPDRVPVRMDLVNETFIATRTAACRPGYSLLSCGIDTRGRHQGERPDHGRYAVPTSATSCQCHDRTKATCDVWCSNYVKGFEVVAASDRKSAVFGVSCPKGKKVLGCNLRPETDKEVWGWNFPTDDGNGCSCYDFFGGTCYATCASNVVRHEVRSEYGRGVVRVNCSPNNYVLGCGVRPEKGGTTENWRYYRVSSVSSCECADSAAGTTCYAICGQFA